MIFINNIIYRSTMTIPFTRIDNTKINPVKLASIQAYQLWCTTTIRVFN